MEPGYSEILSRILNVYASVDQSNVNTILACGDIEPYKKNEIVFHEKRFNAFEYFQLKGISHRFNTGEQNQTTTTGIYQNEVVITPHFTRTTNGQSIFSLQALTDCTFIKVPAGSFRDLMDQHTQSKWLAGVLLKKNLLIVSISKFYSVRPPQKIASFTSDNIIRHWKI